MTRRDYALDPAGVRFPRFSHIRKAYPRDVLSDEPQRHRLLRRGIPYGPPLPAGILQDDGQDRGLLFLAYQASLERQFEHVQRRWFNDGSFPRPGDGPDPLVGQPRGPRRARLRQKGGRTTELHLAQFVSVTAGGYFFAPSIRALARLAGTAAEFDEEESDVAYEEAYSELGEFIFQENPYGAGGHWLLPGFQSVTKVEDLESVERRWHFKGEDHRVRRAIRVPYRYRDEHGKLKTEHLLIGYEGGSGG